MPLNRRTILQTGIGLAGLGLTRRRTFAANVAALPAPLIEAAKKEGALNVITLPRDWANYGVLMDNFAARYGIKIDDANPDGTSAEELQAIRSLKQSRAPGHRRCGTVLRRSPAAEEKLFQPYKVATWDSIPAELKDADGMWYGDYFGVTSFAVNTGVVKTVPMTWADLLKPEYKGMVAIGGSPLKAGEAFGSVFAASLANGGSFDDIKPGIEFFGKLNAAGNFNPVKADTGTVVTGQTPIAIKWDYLNLAIRDGAAGKADIRVLLPEGAPPYRQFLLPGDQRLRAEPERGQAVDGVPLQRRGPARLPGDGYAHPIRFNALVAAGKIRRP